MPSSATITAFYTFTANTKARATQVNGNFDVFRGHLLPINPNTQSAAGNSYDLGSSEHRWRTSYTQSIDLQSNTTTGNALQIIGETTSSTPAIIFKIGGTEVSRIQQTSYAFSAGTTGAFFFGTSTTDLVNLLASTVTVSSNGYPVEFELVPSDGSQASGIGAEATLTSGANVSAYVEMRAYRNTTTSQIGYQIMWLNLNRATSSADFLEISSHQMPISSFKFFDYSAGTSTNNYFFKVAGTGNGPTSSFISNYKVLAKIIK